MDDFVGRGQLSGMIKNIGHEFFLKTMVYYIEQRQCLVLVGHGQCLYEKRIGHGQ